MFSLFSLSSLIVFSFSSIQERRKYLSCHEKSLFTAQLRKKGFGNLLLLWGNCSCETQCLHLAGSGSQSQRRIWFVLPAHEASHISSGINFLTSSCLAFNYNTLKVNLVPFSSNITQIFFEEKKNITQSQYHILIFSVSYILEAQPTSFHRQLMMIYLQVLTVRTPCLEKT